jgi:hypothetical protein
LAKRSETKKPLLQLYTVQSKVNNFFLVKSRSFTFFLGLAELGAEVVKVFLLPKIHFISERIEACMGISNADKIAAEHIKALIVVNLICYKSHQH